MCEINKSGHNYRVIGLPSIVAANCYCCCCCCSVYGMGIDVAYDLRAQSACTGSLLPHRLDIVNYMRWVRARVYGVVAMACQRCAYACWCNLRIPKINYNQFERVAAYASCAHGMWWVVVALVFGLFCPQRPFYGYPAVIVWLCDSHLEAKVMSNDAPQENMKFHIFPTNNVWEKTKKPTKRKRTGASIAGIGFYYAMNVLRMHCTTCVNVIQKNIADDLSAWIV